MWTAALTPTLVTSLWISILLISLCAIATALWAHSLQNKNRKLQRQLLDANETALSDPLTGLQNRRAWDQFLQALDRQATENPASCSDLWMIVLDVDQFKRVNDQFGHQIGDQALAELSMRLRHAFASARLFRIGGEEFVVITKTNPSELYNKLQNFLDNLRNTPMQCSEATIPLSCSAGAENFKPFLPHTITSHTVTPQTVETTASQPTGQPEQKYGSKAWFQQADLAMYDAKGRGGNQAVIH
jgi:diguanylate cyclase (GGDEF)-like protein